MSKTGPSPARKPARSGTSAFRPRARLLKILGAELISDEVVAIGELVKNAHDADASVVTVRFEGASGPDGRITITDDGDGMDIDTVLGRWMQPASSGKGREGMRRTQGGRRLLGEKGVGRFALDKLGAACELITRPRGGRDEVCVGFDWDAFADDGLMLHEIESKWQLRKAREIDQHGTILTLTGLRQLWTERTYRRLCSRLSRLVSPLLNDSSFRIEVESDEFPDYGHVLRQSYLEKSPYRIQVIFDGDRTLEVRFNDGRKLRRRWSGREDLCCGPVEVRIHSFDLESEAVARVGPKMDVRAWLRQWSGVSIYRDDFRIWPYGEPHDDWLRLDRRRVNNPTVRLSNNQVVGSVFITADGNPDLRDQTNREGLINNRALDDLRSLVYEVLQIVEAERQAVRHPATTKRRVGAPVTDQGPSIADEIDKLAGEATGRIASRLRGLARRARERDAREKTGQDALVASLAELAAAGRCAAKNGEALGPLLDDMKKSIRATNRPADVSRNGHRPVLESFQSVHERVVLLTGLSNGVARGRHVIEVGKALADFEILVKPVVMAAGIRLELSDGGLELVRVGMRPATLHRLLHLLLENSMDWLASTPKPRVRLSLSAADDWCELLIADNGPGVSEEMHGTLFEPGSSLRQGATGMGLCMARVITEQHGGTIELLRDGRRIGANFVIRLPRKRVRNRP